MKETENRLDQVRSGTCTAKHREAPPWGPADPAAWELRQLEQFGQSMQSSCNPAKYFTQANDMCPFAYKAHFPCNPNTLDYKFCKGTWGGAIVKGATGPR